MSFLQMQFLSRFWLRALSALIVVGLNLGCMRTASPSREEALRTLSKPDLSDDLDLDSFKLAIARQAQLLAQGHGPEKYQFGKREFSRASYLIKLQGLLAAAYSAASIEDLFPYLEHNFVFQAVYGGKDWGKVLVTGYYESHIAGSRNQTAQYSQPLYGRPPELKDGEMYFSREEIDSGAALAGRGLELCYVDPLDATIIQTQGSGLVTFEDHSALRLAFAGKNGRPFTPVAKFVREKLGVKHGYFDSVEEYLRGLPESERRAILNTNESYVFFEPNSFGARTAMGIPATPGRTVAIDPKLFPKGGIGFLIFDRPGAEPGESNHVSRFVVAQDVGTAIKGPARVDLFVGSGEGAKYEAGRMKSEGLFYFLVPK